MKTVGIILLAYTCTAHLISIISPVPFIGFAVTLLSFPLALKLSIKELFLIEFTGMMFFAVVQFNTLLIVYTSGLLSFSSISFVLFLILIPTVFSVTSFFFAFLMKTLSRFTPKRIKVILNET